MRTQDKMRMHPYPGVCTFHATRVLVLVVLWKSALVSSVYASRRVHMHPFYYIRQFRLNQISCIFCFIYHKCHVLLSFLICYYPFLMCIYCLSLFPFLFNINHKTPFFPFPPPNHNSPSFFSLIQSLILIQSQ